MALINQNSIIGVTSITSPGANNVDRPPEAHGAIARIDH